MYLCIVLRRLALSKENASSLMRIDPDIPNHYISWIIHH